MYGDTDSVMIEMPHVVHAEDKDSNCPVNVYDPDIPDSNDKTLEGAPQTF